MSWRDRVVTFLGAQTPAQVEARVREALSAGIGRTEDQQMAVQGYRRITAGGEILRRDLLPLAQDQHNRLVYWLWESNPVAKWLIETTLDFVLGEGVTVASEAPEVAAVLRAFWDDPVNLMDDRAEDFTREFGLYGELCLPVFVNPIDGHVRLGYIDPLEINEVLTDPDNVLITTAVQLKGPVGQGKLYKVVREDTARASRTFGLLMPAYDGELGGGLTRTGTLIQDRYAGSCLLFQGNKISNARRGRSDLIDLIDWLDGYDQYMFDSMDAAAQLNSFTWDVTLNGMQQDQIDAWLKQQGAMRRGMIRAHNEKVTWNALAPKLEAQDKDAYAKQLLTHIIGARGFPLFFYGEGRSATGASAKEMGQTPLKHLTRRQKRVRRILETMLRFACDQKIARGLLPREVVMGATVSATGDSQGVLRPVRDAISIGLPEISSKDQAAIVAALTGLTASLVEAQQVGWVRPETATKLFAALASQLGIEIDPEHEYQPGTGPNGAALTPYGSPVLQQHVERLMAQLGRKGDGNADTIGEPKRAAA